ncbi:hypothetical protein [Poseidonocella sp. HB161398]|uniref:hypothetical protein n=1 Tax=Poseidonocella sp. HB161398 TaxID=2320855 RepID=UPI001108EA4F|nr:hypothetical protein [Poseidonocella sp. HB161398]
MSHIDCRGLSAPLAVLRIKQAILNVPGHALPLLAQLDDGCAPDAVAAGLRAHACDVRLATDIEPFLPDALPSGPGPAMTAHV